MLNLILQRKDGQERPNTIAIFLCSFAIISAFTVLFSSPYVQAQEYPAIFAESASSPFGIVFNKMKESNLEDKAFAMLGELGTKWVRLRIPWSKLEPRRGQYSKKDFEELDRFIDRLVAKRINIVGWLSSGRVPVWALQVEPGGKTPKGQKAIKHTPPNPEDLRDFLVYIIRRYKTRIKNWIILNEVSGSKNKNTPPRLVKVMRLAYPAAKKEDPDCNIIMAGIGYGNFQQYCDQFFSLGGGSYIDTVNRHMYFHLSRIPSEIPLTRMIMRKYNLNKPIQIGEFSNPSHYKKPSTVPQRSKGPWKYPEGTSDAQAQLLVKRMVQALSEGVVKMFQSDIRDKASSLEVSQREGDKRGIAAWQLASGYFWSKGITDYYYRPKPAFYAYKTLIEKLEGTQFDRELYFNDNLRVFVFKKNGKLMLVFWAWGEGENNQEISLKVKGQELVVSDKFGKKVKTVRASRDHIKLAVTPDPMFLHWALAVEGGGRPPAYEQRYKTGIKKRRKRGSY